MQTLMEDYETHKVKRREKLEDNSVSELHRQLLFQRQKLKVKEIQRRPVVCFVWITGSDRANMAERFQPRPRGI